MQLTLTMKMTTAQERPSTVNNNSPIRDYVLPGDHQSTYKMTPGFKPFTVLIKNLFSLNYQYLPQNIAALFPDFKKCRFLHAGFYRRTNV